jgi:hypothetical protein
MTAETEHSHPFQILPIVAAAFYGVLITTGALTLVLVIAAAMSGGSVTDLFAEVFPRFRGGTNTTQIPGLGYAIFIIYTVVASTIAVMSRRRFARRWSRRADQ